MRIPSTKLFLVALLSFGLCLDVFADREQVRADWTFHVTDVEFGLTGYASGTTVSFGAGELWVPLRIETLTGVLAVASLLICGFSLYALRRRHANAA
jgi:hypothetical protein